MEKNTEIKFQVYFSDFLSWRVDFVNYSIIKFCQKKNIDEKAFFCRRSEFLEIELKTLTAVHAEKLKEHETLSQKLLESERYFLLVRVLLIFTIFSFCFVSGRSVLL